MTTKILTVRLPSPLYAALCRDAGELGVPVAAHLRRLLERESDAEQLDGLRRELLGRLDALAAQSVRPAAPSDELLLLCRGIAAEVQPQLVAQVRAKLAQVQR